MAKHIITAGATSQRFYIYLQNSTTGQGQTGVTSATCYYLRDSVSGSMPAAVTLTFGAIFASPGTYPTWTSGQVREIGYMPGIYLIDLPDAVFAASAKNAVVQIVPVTGTAWLPVNLEFSLSAVDMNDSVRMGMTALPNTAVSTNGSLITAGTGTNQLSTTGGGVSVGSLAAGVITASSIASDAFQASKFQDGALVIGSASGTGVKAYLGASAIAAGNIASDALQASKFQDSALVIGSAAGTGVKAYLGANSVTAGVIATDAIDSDAIANSAITIRLTTDGTNSEGRLFATAVASDVWNADYSLYTTAGTMGKLMDNLRKSNYTTTGTTTAGSTSTSINTNLTGYALNAFDNQTILIISGTYAGSSTIINGSSSGGGVITLDEPLPGAPASGVDFVILGTHVHTKQGIANTILNTDPAVFASGTSAYWLYQSGLNSQTILSNVQSLTSTAWLESTADVFLGRNIAGGSNGVRTVTDALRALRNKSAITASTLTVYREDDTTTAWTATVSSSASADPVTGIDPA